MSRFFKYGILVLVLGGIITSACGQNETPTDERGGAEPVPVAESIFAFGVVKAKDIRNITIDFPARVEEVPISVDQVVQEGQVLAVLDISAYELQIRKKQVELNMEKLELERLLDSRAKLGNELQAAQELFDLAVKELNKYELLFTEGAVSEAELDQFREIAIERELALKNLQLAVGGDKESPEVQLQRQKIALLERELSQMQDKLDKDYLAGNEIRAAVHRGVVSDLGYRPGDVLVPEEKLCSVIDLNSIIVEAEVAEEFVREVKIGSPALITPLADRSRVLTGTVTELAGNAVDRKGETVVLTEIEIDNPDHFLLPGYNVDVEITR